MICYPVIIPTLNRYDHFKACVLSLSQCELANETELIIGLDFPPSDKYVNGWKKIKEWIPSITGFKKVTCLERSENFGSGRNSNDLQEYALKHYDAYIYSEDDNIFSKSFLKFIDFGLEKYKNDKSVIAICGYSYPINWETENSLLFQGQYFSAWGFGEWGTKRREIINFLNGDNLGENLKNFKNRKNLKKRSKKNYRYASWYLYYDSIPLLDITRSIYMCLMNKWVLMPSKTLVKNNGFDGSGEHKELINVISMTKQLLFDINNFETINPDKIYSRNLEFFNQSFDSISIWTTIVVKLKYLILFVLGYDKAKSLFKKIKVLIK